MARITQQSSIHTTGTSYENEPIIKSDAASSDVMEWAASTGTSKVEIREDASNNLKLEVDGVPVASGLAGIDGAGLHLDGATGLIDIPGSGSAPVVALGTKLSFEFIIQAHNWGVGTEYIFDFGTSGRTLLYNAGNNLALEIGGASGLDLGVDVLGDGKVHHLVLAIDGTSLKVYDNANEVASKTISAPTIDAAADGVLGARFNSSTTYCFNGTFYRARFWNKTLTAAEVTASYENATVPFADQYGSQTNLISATDDQTWSDAQADTGNDVNDRATFDAAYSWFAWNSTDISVASNVFQFSTSGAGSRGTYKHVGVEGGKKYRATIRTGTITGNTYKFYAGGDAAAYEVGDLVASTTNIFEFTAAAGGNGYIYILAEDATAGTIQLDASSVSNEVVEIGCVADFDLAFAQPEISTIVQNRNNTVLMDGTSSATGVSQVTKIEAVNTNKLNVGGTTPLVGIGLAAGSTPSAPLEVVGNVRANVSNAGGFFLTADTGLVRNLATGVALRTAGTDQLVVDTDGNVAIGGLTPNTLLTVECNTTGESIVDGIRIQNAHGVDNDIAPMYFGVHGGTRRAKAAIGLKRIGAYGIGELRFAVDSTGDDADVSFANDTKLTIDSAGNATFAGGITVTGKTVIGGETELTISSGEVTATSSFHKVDTENDAVSDAADTDTHLVTINGGIVGMMLVLSTVDGARDVVVKHGTGNVYLSGASDFTINHPRSKLTLIYRTGQWSELSRSTNI